MAGALPIRQRHPYVKLDNGEPFCSCQHVFAVEFIVHKEQHRDGITIETQAVRVTYGQNWPVYSCVHIHEQERFPELLGELCKGIVQPKQTGAGRRSHPLSDIVMAACYKVYSTVFGRRAMIDLRELQGKRFLSRVPSYNSIFDCLHDPALTPLLRSLIEESAKPLKAIQTDFAVDSSGFATTTYNRWYDHKWGKERSEANYIETQLMCGVKTQVVTSIEVTATESADAPHFEGLVNKTAETFTIDEISGDKAYSSKKNLRGPTPLARQPTFPTRATRRAARATSRSVPCGSGCGTSTTSTATPSYSTTTSGRTPR